MRPCFASLIVVAVSLHASAVPTTNSNGSVMTPNSELTRNQLVATDVSGLLSSESDPNVVFTNGELLVHGERVKIGPDETEVQEIASAVVAPVASSVTNLSSSVSDLQSSKADRSEIPGNYLSVSNKAMTAVQVESDPTVYAWAKQPNPPAETDPTVKAWAKADNPPAETDPTVHDWAKQPNPPAETDPTVKPWAKADKPPAETDPTVHDWAKQPNPPAETDPTVKPWAKADKPPAETDPTVHDWAKQPNPPKGMTTNAVERIANAAVETNALTVAITNRVALLESSKADKSALAAHVANTDNPHAVTAAQVGAVPFVKDKNGNKTAVTIGSRDPSVDVGSNSLANGDGEVASGDYSHAEGSATTAAGNYSHAEGSATTAAGDYSHAEGAGTTAAGDYSHAEGISTTASGYGSHAEGRLAHTKEQDQYAFAWNGDGERDEYDPYESHGAGTFNINPVGGLNGFWIGEQTLYTILTNKADKSALAAHVANTTNNPHAVTAEQVGALPLVEDKYGDKTAVTIGTRNPVDVGSNSLANGDGVVTSGDYSHAEGSATTAAGDYSHAEGSVTTAAGDYSHAEGVSTTAAGDCSHAEGCYAYTKEQDSYAFAWNGDWERMEMYDPYESHGVGTFNINPVGGLNGFWIGEKTLYAILTNKADKADISSTNPTFSNAVLAVNVDFATNTTGAAYVAVTNALAGFGFDAEALAELPGGKVYGSVGGLLAALAAAVAWLKKNKVQTLKLEDGSVETSADGGVAKLDAFFTESNSLLTGTIDTEVISKGTAPDAHLEAPTDEHLKLILADNSVAYDSAKALPYKFKSAIGDRVIATMTLTAASTDITLPAIAANDTTVKDFILDVTNAYAVEGVATDAGINIPHTGFKLVTRDGESLTAVTTVKAGKSAFICFTQKSPVVVDGTTYPCWCVIQLPFGDPS